jgi:hypothetical protein
VFAQIKVHVVCLAVWCWQVLSIYQACSPIYLLAHAHTGMWRCTGAGTGPGREHLRWTAQDVRCAVVTQWCRA